MSHIDKNALTDLNGTVSFGGGGGGSYGKKDGVGGAVEYQNIMRSVGYLNTQDYAGQQAEHWRKSSEGVLREMGSYAAFGVSVGAGAAIGGVPGAIVGGVTHIAGKF